MRSRLNVLTLAVSLLLVIAFTLPLGLLVRQLAHDRAVTTAESTAQVTALSLSAADVSTAESVAATVAGQGDPNLTVILADGTELGQPLQPGEDISSQATGVAGRNVLVGGEAVYAPAFFGGEIAVVRVFVPDDDLTRGVRGAWISLALLAFGLIAFGLLLSDRMGRILRRPINDLADAANQLSKGDLSVRVVPSGPAEIATVGTQFNTLASEVTGLLQRERENAADLSHRLRTPMASLKLDIEQLDDAEEQEKLLVAMSELERAVDFVIHETRRPNRSDSGETTDVIDVLVDRFDFWQALADDQERSASLETPNHGCLVELSRSDCEAALDAIIGNVFAHTPDGSPLAISTEFASDEDLLHIHVDDAGPGLVRASLDRGVSGASSTGLGLDIARRTAESTGGSLLTGTSLLGGTRITLALRGRMQPSG